MNYNNPIELERMKHLISYGVNEDAKHDDNTAKVEYMAKAADGQTYGIIKECNKFYIKVAPKKDTQVIAEDFDYIGGFMNRKENEYKTYTIASKQLDLKLMSINEAYNNKVKVNQYKETQESDWQINETKEMRNEINRFNQIMNNVNYILAEDKGGFTMNHTLPEAPASNPSDKKVNSPFTDTAVAKGDKDFKETETNHEKAGKPFDNDAKVTDKDMTSDKKPEDKTDDGAYSEKPQYVETGVAGQHPKGGKVVKVNEGKRTIKLTEEQVLAWNKSKDFMDKTNGTEIGSSTPFTDAVGQESNQTEAPTEKIHENSEVVHNNDNQNSPAPGTNEVGDTAPFDKKVNESDMDVDDIAGMPDENEEVPFPDVEDGGSYLDFEDEYNDWLENGEGVENNDAEFDFDDDDFAQVQDFVNDADGFDFNESKQRNVNEDELHDFGKHPAYRKTPMTLPPNKEVAKNGAKDWNDKSVEGEQPFGNKIGDSSPFTEEVINILTDAIMKKMGFSKKA